MDRRYMGNLCPTNIDPRTKQQIQDIQLKKKNEFYYNNKHYIYQAEESKKDNNRTNSNGNKVNKKNQNNSIIQLDSRKNKDDYYVSSSAYGSGVINNINIINNANHTLVYTSNRSTNQAKTNEKDLCGIKNIGNNCYLNSGLQILARCSSFSKKLAPFNSNKYPFIMHLYQVFESLLNKKEYDPSLFVKYFCEKNKDFVKGEQSCSQNFIRTVLNNVNDEIKSSKSNCINSYTNYYPIDPNEKKAYKTYIEENNIYPESSALYTFTGILKSHTVGQCDSCKNIFNKYTFCYFIDQNMYLDNLHSRCNFQKVINENLPPYNNIEMECLHCKSIMKIKEETKLVKLPEILIFTLERFLGGPNKVEIIPDDILDLGPYIDPNLKEVDTIYELFAINIRFGSTKNWGHEICQIKLDGGYWYEFNDNTTSLKKRDYNNSSYGLYYRKVSS